MHAMARTPDCSMIVYARFDCTLASQSAVYDIDSAVLSVSCQFITLISMSEKLPRCIGRDLAIAKEGTTHDEHGHVRYGRARTYLQPYVSYTSRSFL